MRVYPSQAAPVEPMRLQETQNLFLFRDTCFRQGFESTENFRSVVQRPTGQFAHNEGVANNLILVEQGP